VHIRPEVHVVHVVVEGGGFARDAAALGLQVLILIDELLLAVGFKRQKHWVHLPYLLAACCHLLVFKSVVRNLRNGLLCEVRRSLVLLGAALRRHLAHLVRLIGGPDGVFLV